MTRVFVVVGGENLIPRTPCIIIIIASARLYVVSSRVGPYLGMHTRFSGGWSYVERREEEEEDKSFAISARSRSP